MHGHSVYYIFNDSNIKILFRGRSWHSLSSKWFY